MNSRIEGVNCTHAVPPGQSCSRCNADIDKLKQLVKAEPDEITSAEMFERLKNLVEQTSLGKAAKQIGVSKSYLSKVMIGDLPISDKVAALFGYTKVVVYKKR